MFLSVCDKLISDLDYDENWFLAMFIDYPTFFKICFNLD